MSLKKHTPRLLSVVLLIAFMLAGCLGGDDIEPDAANDDDANDDELNGLDDDESNGDGGANGDNGDGNGNGNGNGNGDGDDENGNDEICTVSQTSLGSLEMSGEAIPDLTNLDPTDLDPTSLDPSNLTATVTETISVPETAESLTITVAAGEYIGQWSVALLDPSGGEAYSAAGELPFGIQEVQGGDFSETATITGPAAGDWTLEIGGLGMLIDAVTAAVDATVCT